MEDPVDCERAQGCFGVTGSALRRRAAATPLARLDSRARTVSGSGVPVAAAVGAAFEVWRGAGVRAPPLSRRGRPAAV
jgi:hypothetical protein